MGAVSAVNWPRPGSRGWAGCMNGRFTVEVTGDWFGGLADFVGWFAAAGAGCVGAKKSFVGLAGFAGGGSTGPSVESAAGFFTSTDVSPSLALVEFIQTASEQQAASADNVAILFQ